MRKFIFDWLHKKLLHKNFYEVLKSLTDQNLECFDNSIKEAQIAIDRLQVMIIQFSEEEKRRERRSRGKVMSAEQITVVHHLIGTSLIVVRLHLEACKKYFKDGLSKAKLMVEEVEAELEQVNRKRSELAKDFLKIFRRLETIQDYVKIISKEYEKMHQMIDMDGIIKIVDSVIEKKIDLNLERENPGEWFMQDLKSIASVKGDLHTCFIMRIHSPKRALEGLQKELEDIIKIIQKP